MTLPGRFIVAAVLSLLPASFVSAQLRPLYLNEAHYRRLGLESAWSTQLEVDSRTSDVAAVTLQIVGLNSYEYLQATVQHVFEVTYDEKSPDSFSPRMTWICTANALVATKPNVSLKSR